jgi:hypothetical protein
MVTFTRNPKETTMATMHTADPDRTGFELRFRSIYNEGRGLAFPCDAEGHVVIDSLSTKGRLNYLYARTLIGREFQLPVVLPRTLH